MDHALVTAAVDGQVAVGEHLHGPSVLIRRLDERASLEEAITVDLQAEVLRVDEVHFA